MFAASDRDAQLDNADPERSLMKDPSSPRALELLAACSAASPLEFSMARAKVVHSADAVHVLFRGDKRSPEPSTAVIQFPGGHVEVSRCSDGTYWAHTEVVHPSNIVASRIDYDHEGCVISGGAIPAVPYHDRIQHIAIQVANTVPRFDPNE